MASAVRLVVVLKTSMPSMRKVRLLAQVVRALVPGVLLVVAPIDTSAFNVPENSIALDAEVVEADPLAVAVALHRGAAQR